MSLLLTAIKALLTAFFGSLWGRLFPPKTAADQKCADLTKSLDEVKDANKISTQVDEKSRAAVNTDLAKFVRSDE